MKTVALLSGGLDSAVALAMQQNVTDVDTLFVNYGQRNARREQHAASAIAAHYDVAHTFVDVGPWLFEGSALTDSTLTLPDGVATAVDATYVPARNTVLIALAAARSESIGAKRVIIGANADDAAAYPDCRWRYIEAMRAVLQDGTRDHVWLDAPLISMRKTDVVDCARRLRVPVELTWSCYSGGETPCGTCGACILRKEAMG